MPRRKLIHSDLLPYHVTARCNNKEIFPLSMDRIWSIFGSECLFMSLIYDVEFHAAVLMPNHIHILLTVPQKDLGRIMNIFMSNFAKSVNSFAGKQGHLFGGPYYGSLIQSSRYFGHALKYVYRNPVKAGLCGRVEDYPFSTLHGLTGKAHLPFPINLTRVGMEIGLPDFEDGLILNWLNQPFSKEVDNLIGRGLKKQVFDDLKRSRIGIPYPELQVLH